MTGKLKTLIIDNYDSFVYNLVQYIGEQGGNPVVYRNDELSLAEIEKIQPTHIVISPGPGNPTDKHYFGICNQVILKYGKKIPLLGVCLGHQGICAVFGGKIVQAPEIMHGKISMIKHNNQGIFKGLQNYIKGMRYHSLICERASLPTELEITAETEDGIVMGVQHKKFPIYGIQFHPESIGTEEGKRIVGNFLGMTKIRKG